MTGAGSLRSDLTLANPFFVGADIVGWDNNLDQSFGLLARISNPGFGTTRGYAFTYSTSGFISSDQAPWRVPTFMSNSCRVI